MPIKSAIITGGTRGIGLSISKVLLEEGYRLVIFGRSLEQKVRQPLRSLRDIGQVEYICGDIAVTADIKRCVEEAAVKYGKIDLLVNNAGVAPPERKSLLMTDEANFDYVIDRNLRGTFFMTQAAARKMSVQNDGMIINISSMSAYTSSTNRGEYCISKAGISMITKLFADEMAQYGVYIYEIRPGIIKTDMTAKVADKYDRLIEQGVFPIKRWGTPQDVADCVKLLASGLLPYTTGEVINVDGGFHLRRM